MFRSERTSGADLGGLYWVNTAGAALGCFAAGFLLIPSIGVASTNTLAASGNALAGIAALLIGRRPQMQANARSMPGTPRASALAYLLVLMLAPNDIRVWRSANERKLLYYREGVSAAVSIVADHDGQKIMKLNNHYGLGGGAGVLLERRMGHLSVLLHPHPKRVLLIGLGTGATAGAVSLHHDLRQIEVVEIAPEVVEAARLFADENHRLHENPRVRIVVDDGRRYLKTSREVCDLIIADLFLPWQAGDGNLYTLEHYSLARTKLAPGGMFVQWLPLYQLSVEHLGIIAKTFRSVFPQTDLWLGALRTPTPIAALVGGEREVKVDPARLKARLSTGGAAAVEIENIALDEVEAVAALFVGAQEALDGLTQRARINRYDRPLIEFSAPATFHRRERLRSETLAALARVRRFPGPQLLVNAEQEQLATAQRYYDATTAILQGVLRSYEGDDRGEQEAYLAALAQAPRYQYLNQVLVTMSAELMRQGRLNAAEHLARQIARINPRNYEAATNLGASLRLSSDATRKLQRSCGRRSS